MTQLTILTYPTETRSIECLHCLREATLSDFCLADGTIVAKGYYCPHCGPDKALYCPPEIPFGPPITDHC